MDSGSGRRRTRLQEKREIEKYFEDKKKRQYVNHGKDSNVSKNFESVDLVEVENFDKIESAENCCGKNSGKRKQKSGELDQEKSNVGLKRRYQTRRRGNSNAVSSDDSDDSGGIICLGESGPSNSTPKKRGSGDDGVLCLGEEVVSNNGSSRVPSSLGSGVNSACAEGRNWESFRVDEAVSSGMIRDETNNVSGRIPSEAPNSDLGKETDEVASGYVSVSEESDDSPVLEESEKWGKPMSSSDVHSHDSDDKDFELVESDDEVGEEEERESADDFNNVSVTVSRDINRKLESDFDKEAAVDCNYDHELDGENNNDMKGGKTGRKRKEIVIEGGLIRRMAFGMEVLYDCNGNSTTKSRTVAQRLRPRSISKSRKKKLLAGTFSCPLQVPDDDKSESLSDSEEEEDEINSVYEKKGGGDRPRRQRLKNQRKYALNSLDFVNIVADRIWEKEQSLKPNEGTTQMKLPMKFTGGDENQAKPEKEEWEKEVDCLFEEMERDLRVGEIGSTYPSMDENYDMISSEIETSPAERCSKGEHDLFIDEQIGRICRYCSFVLEWKHIFPDFAKDPFRRWEKKDSSESESASLLDELQLSKSAHEDCLSSPNTKGTVWEFIPGMNEKMYPHQREGFEFIWQNIGGGINTEKLSKSLADGGNGCIISHAPGTGKTCLAIAFLLSFMELYPSSRPVIVAPSSMLLTWEEEFQKWNAGIPFYNMKKLLSPKENDKAMREFRTVRQDKNSSRMLKLCFWRRERSVLGISYRLFEKLAGEYGDAEKEPMRKILLELSDVLVLDEGHTPRNDRSRMWKALSEVKTKRRIILSGTPFQNNFTELYTTLCLVNPQFADQIDRSIGSRGRRSGQTSCRAKGAWYYLTSTIGKDSEDRIDELKRMIDPFVHVYKGTILQSRLPGLRHSRLDLQPTASQTKLLNIIENNTELQHFRKKHLVSMISVHPSLVAHCEEEFSDDERCNLKRLESFPDAGVKTKFVIGLIRLCDLHERVLVFSQYISPLQFIMEQLKSQLNYHEGREVLYMDGGSDAHRRQLSISTLNDPDSDARVLLASTRACSEGINLIGASRVVLLDVVWNPSVARQAISRAYRLGQEKVVHVYHLITSGSLEARIFQQQTQKDHYSKLVFCSKDSNNCQAANQTSDLEDKILESMVQHKHLQDIFHQIHQLPRIY